jgi:hypothetical protein
VIFYNNQICVNILENLMFHDNSKHIEIQYYYLHYKFHKGEINIQYISIDEKTTDILMKPLSRAKFVYFMNKL